MTAPPSPRGWTGRRLSIFALALVSFTGAFTASLAFFPSLFDGEGPRRPLGAQEVRDGAAKWIPFLHRKHVHEQWKYDEVGRDCRGCHEYPGDEKRRRDPTEFCVECHIDGTERGRKPLDSYFPSKPAHLEARSFPATFFHHDHIHGKGDAEFQCRDCHLKGSEPSREKARPRAVPDVMPIPDGIGWCSFCHDPREGRPDSTGHPDLDAFSGAMNESPDMAFRAIFKHLEHLDADGLASSRDCDDCHRATRGADHRSFAQEGIRFDWGEDRSCRTCHVEAADDETLEPLDIQGSSQPAPSATMLTFSHEQHLRPSVLEDPINGKEIREKGCLACHTPETTPPPDPDARRAWDVWAKDGRFVSYEETCVSACHFHRQDENWYPIDDHGTEAQVEACAPCHELGRMENGELVSMTENRPEVVVKRTRGNRFGVERNTHPFITEGDPGPVKEACQDCHRAEIPELPSRIQTRRFRHDTHLPEKWKGEDCEECHQGIGGTSGPEEIDTRFGGAIYNLDACSKCHRSEVEIIPVQPMVVEQSVVRFPHLSHVGVELAGEPMSCQTCHDFRPGGNPDESAGDGDHEWMVTLPEARTCTQCHDHEENAEITSDRDPRYIADCERCHTSGVPAVGQSVNVSKFFLTGAVSRQAHPTSAQRASLSTLRNPDAGSTDPAQGALCASCHRDVKPELGFRSPNRNKETVARLDSPVQRAQIHARKTYEGNFHDAYDYREGKNPETCVFCHWKNLEEPRFDVMPSSPESLPALRRELGPLAPGGYPWPR